MDGKSGTGTGKMCRETGNRDQNGKVYFSRNGKKRERGKYFFLNGNGKDYLFPVHAYRGNFIGTSCFPVRRTGTLLVYIYKRECLSVCGAKCSGTSRCPRKLKFFLVIGFATKPKEKLRKPEISIKGRNQGPLKVSP